MSLPRLDWSIRSFDTLSMGVTPMPPLVQQEGEGGSCLISPVHP